MIIAQHLNWRIEVVYTTLPINNWYCSNETNGKQQRNLDLGLTIGTRVKEDECTIQFEEVQTTLVEFRTPSAKSSLIKSEICKTIWEIRMANEISANINPRVWSKSHSSNPKRRIVSTNKPNYLLYGPLYCHQTPDFMTMIRIILSETPFSSPFEVEHVSN